MMKLFSIGTILVALAVFQTFFTVKSQRQMESHRELKCDRDSGRCHFKGEESIEEEDKDFKTDSPDKEGPPELTRGGLTERKYEPVVEGDCKCVDAYLCQDGHIVRDGSGMIDLRHRRQTNPEEFEEVKLPLDGKFKPASCGLHQVCCAPPKASMVIRNHHGCGVRNPSVKYGRILPTGTGGEGGFGEWPWHAAVLKMEGKGKLYICGGVLIDKYHVLTVAHCVFNSYKYNEYQLKVRLGEWNTRTASEPLPHQDYNVSKIIVHPDFKNDSLWNDIALLRLKEQVVFAQHIDTICLPQYDKIFAGQNCIVTGWGKDAFMDGTFSDILKYAPLPVIDDNKCEEMLRKTRLSEYFELHEGFLCAGGDKGVDSCKGDGGGPLVCKRQDNTYALAGLVSWGIDCGRPGVPGVYIKVQKYLDWISKSTGVNLQEYWPTSETLDERSGL